jgi:hypothetical protein
MSALKCGKCGTVFSSGLGFLVPHRWKLEKKKHSQPIGNKKYKRILYDQIARNGYCNAAIEN